MTVSERLALNVRRLRFERGWSQARLGGEANLSQAIVSNIERGLWPTDEEASALAQALTVPIAELEQPLSEEQIVSVCAGRLGSRRTRSSPGRTQNATAQNATAYS